jgi:hypothetical protein
MSIYIQKNPESRAYLEHPLVLLPSGPDTVRASKSHGPRLTDDYSRNGGSILQNSVDRANKKARCNVPFPLKMFCGWAWCPVFRWMCENSKLALKCVPVPI